jgi:hypothetical protein
MADLLGTLMFNANLDYAYDSKPCRIWLVIIRAISILASAKPARSATRVNVRESSAYA